jgi:hypothetical protein
LAKLESENSAAVPPPRDGENVPDKIIVSYAQRHHARIVKRFEDWHQAVRFARFLAFARFARASALSTASFDTLSDARTPRSKFSN